MKSSMLVVLLFLSACASVPLTSEEQAVRLLRKSDAPAECKEIGKITLSNWSAMTEENRDESLRRKGYAIGANLVTVDRIDDKNMTYSTAHSCP